MFEKTGKVLVGVLAASLSGTPASTEEATSLEKNVTGVPPIQSCRPVTEKPKPPMSPWVRKAPEQPLCPIPPKVDEEPLVS